MRRMLYTLRGENRARAFLLTYAQSALGNGMALVALVVLAYELVHAGVLEQAVSVCVDVDAV